MQSAFTWLAIALGLVVAVIFFLTTSWDPVVVWLATWTVVTFALYGYDKFQAKRGGIRVPEAVLHGLALIGGFAGGWLGMFAFNHKKRKRSFWTILIASTVLWGLLMLVISF